MCPRTPRHPRASGASPGLGVPRASPRPGRCGEGVWVRSPRLPSGADRGPFPVAASGGRYRGLRCSGKRRLSGKRPCPGERLSPGAASRGGARRCLRGVGWGAQRNASEPPCSGHPPPPPPSPCRCTRRYALYIYVFSGYFCCHLLPLSHGLEQSMHQEKLISIKSYCWQGGTLLENTPESLKKSPLKLP